ncbi:transglutaminase family protein [Oryzomonas japonica]|uniref:Transglutaminase family protein n=2 Tax=Oryzomonas japonica TaxID=2603858 RepID=A0A7J4ZSE2_9BACT|nr:transglutaminase family protein [Oryzomonas japonica]
MSSLRSFWPPSPPSTRRPRPISSIPIWKSRDMRYFIEHETVLEYPEAVREHHVELRLTPREDSYQRLLGITLETEPTAGLRGYRDYYGNQVTCFDIIQPHRRLVTRMRAEVENTLANPFDFQPLSPGDEQERLREALRTTPALYDYILSRSPATPNLGRLDQGFAFPCHEPGRPVLESVQQAMEWITTVLRYKAGVTTVHSTLAQALTAAAGVCQDFAHLLIAIVRSWKIPARYVMGYLASREEGAEEAPPATHAWTEVFIPGRGWTGFDATQQILANDLFIPVAVGRDYLDAAPQRGSFKGDAAGDNPVIRLSISQQ